MKNFSLDRWIMKNLEIQNLFKTEEKSNFDALMDVCWVLSPIHGVFISIAYYHFEFPNPLFLLLYFVPFLFDITPNRTPDTPNVLAVILAPLYFPLRIGLINVLHLGYPGHEKRKLELEAFMEANIKEEVTMDDGLVYTDLFNSDVNKFLETHLQLTQSFKRFFLEKMTDGEYTNYNKIMATLLIPRRQTMPIDHLREIILSLKEVPDNLIASSVKIIQSGRLDEFFTNISNEQIKSIFTRPFDMTKYINLLVDSISIELQDPTFSPAITLRELIDNAPVTHELREVRLHHKSLKNLKIDGYRVQLLLSKNDFVSASENFRNCVQSYHKHENQDCFVLFKGTTPIACVRVEDNKIVEMRGYRNERLHPSVEKQINQAFKKVL